MPACVFDGEGDRLFDDTVSAFKYHTLVYIWLLDYLTATVNCLGYVTLNNRMMRNDSMGKMWKEAVIYFKVLCMNILGGVEKNHKRILIVPDLRIQILIWYLLNAYKIFFHKA
jgi:hypothetical protein